MRVRWLGSAQTAFTLMPAWIRLSVETALENVAALVQFASPEQVGAELHCDSSGLFELIVGEVTLFCHVDLFGTNAVTVKRALLASPVP